jgi:hypothetical protein
MLQKTCSSCLAASATTTAKKKSVELACHRSVTVSVRPHPKNSGPSCAAIQNSPRSCRKQPYSFASRSGLFAIIATVVVAASCPWRSSRWRFGGGSVQNRLLPRFFLPVHALSDPSSPSPSARRSIMTSTTLRNSDGTITISPRKESIQSGLVVFCHGLGDTSEGFADVAEVGRIERLRDASGHAVRAPANLWVCISRSHDDCTCWLHSTWRRTCRGASSCSRRPR